MIPAAARKDDVISPDTIKVPSEEVSQVVTIAAVGPEPHKVISTGAFSEVDARPCK